MGADARGSGPDAETITVRESDGVVVATDETTGVSSQGDTNSEALANLAEALELNRRSVPREKEPETPAEAPWFDD